LKDQDQNKVKIQVANVPVEVLPIVADYVRGFGVDVLFGEGKLRGAVRCVSGSAVFEHNGKEDGGGVLSVTVLRNEGHFTERMLIGGLRQLVGEAVEGVGGKK
jgi:hypothetical protein